MTPHQQLRAETAAAHDRVDRAFAGFDLADAADYGDFLAAHAAAALAVEAAIDEAGMAALLDDWPARRRAALLRDDLAALDRPLPPSLPFALEAGPAAAWGAAYVLEGSRLGGALLARSVAAGLPHAYLATPLPKGAWRKFLAALDESLYPAEMRLPAIRAALSVFALFETAATEASFA